MKKGGFLRNVLDTIRSNPGGQQATPGGSGSTSGPGSSVRNEFGGQLKSNHFSVAQVSRHGFPEQPTALAYDPVQKIAAIGTKDGELRIFGRPGVDVWAQHKPAYAVTHIKFIINQGAIITVTSDESIHLWSLRGPNLKIQVSACGQHNTGGGTSPAAHSPSPASAAGASNPSSAQAQPGDADYLTDQLIGGSSSPTGVDQNKQLYKQPEILHTLKFEREHITCLHQTLMSKWLYIGTERGNVHVANVETFELSGYSIAWNKAIELSRKTHPGSIIHISECPQDTNKLLIGYESGCIALWDLKSRSAEGRYYYAENLLWLAWHFEGKQFVAAHGDGSLVTWQIRSNARPVKVVHPHAKSPQGDLNDSFQQQQHLASSFARSLNNELYRPINKVEWKTSKSSNEQFFLFSGGLPYDGLEHDQHPSSVGASNQNLLPLRQSADPTSQQARLQATSQQQQQQYLKAASASPSSHLASPSPMSPSISPSSAHDSGFKSASRQSALNHNQAQLQHLQQLSREKKCLRSTSLTVMFGKSITVLEMDETIIDFITVCDNSPYENDTSDPFAVLVLLSNDLILIDLTSSGYPSFDSPYPSGSLNESPVTCVYYLADCSSDLIPFLYSNSQNVISRVPKKGFSDKEWPINGGEWGQAMQSYPELVLTGHSDGTIKFWDMSGVNFDLISKIKTAKLFERPNKPTNNLVILSHQQQQLQHHSHHKRAAQQSLHNLTPKPNSPQTNEATSNFSFPSPSSTLAGSQLVGSELESNFASQATLDQRNSVNNYFAIEQIEYNSSTKHLLVAGALSQVIQFKLHKSTSGSSGGDTTVVLVEPQQTNQSPTATTAQQSASSAHDTNLQAQQQQKLKQHLLFRARSNEASSISGTGSTSSSTTASSQQRSRLSGFQPSLICLTPLLMLGNSMDDISYCYAPPRVTALAFQAAHNILAYSHESGVVLIDIIQKCVIMNASLCDLYGGASVMASQRDIVSIQPFDTSSILQQHYQSGANLPGGVSNNNIPPGPTSFARIKNQPGEGNTNNGSSDHLGKLTRCSDDNNGGASNDNGNNPSSLHKSANTTNESGPAHSELAGQKSSSSLEQQQQQLPKSRFTTNSMFQRQLSTNALNAVQRHQPSRHSPSSSASQSTAAAVAAASSSSSASRLLARQMTASQLLGSSGGPPGTALQQPYQQLAGSASNLTSAASDSGSGTPVHARPGTTRGFNERASEQQHQAASGAEQQKKAATKNKRIISRMLSISAIHTSATPPAASSTATNAAASLNPHSNAIAFATDQSQYHQTAGDNLQTTSEASPPLHTTGGAYMTMTTAAAAAVGDQVPSDKIDSSFTRSRSSSCSSSVAPNDNGNGAESIQCLCFLDWTLASQPASPVPPTASTGNNNKSLDSQVAGYAPIAGQLALWLGTSQGCVLLVSLTMPDNEDNRVLQLQSVQADPIPQAKIKLPGAILCLSSFGSICSPSSGGASSSGQHLASQSSSQESELVAPSHGQDHSSTSSSSDLDRGSATFLAIVSEKQAKVFKVPSHQQQHQAAQHHPTTKHSSVDHHHHHQHHHQEKQALKQADLAETQMAKFLIDKANCFAKAQLSDSSQACCAGLMQMRQPDETCLASYLATGHIQVHALPQLRLLMETDFLPYSSPLIGQSMRFSRNGHALYQPSQGVICKFTVSSHYKALLQEMTGALYVPREMPEMPRTNFFKSLFSVATSSAASRQSDRDELFGESSAGKASRGVAKHISSNPSSAMDKLKGAAVGSMGHEMRMAREGLDERGEKLGDIEDRTLQMMNQSENYAQAAHQLAQKFKDKKWYQF